MFCNLFSAFTCHPYFATHGRNMCKASGIAFVLYYQQNRPVLLSERGNCFSVVFNSAKYPNKNFKLSAILFFLLRLNPDTFFISVHHYDLLFFFFFGETCDAWTSVDFQFVVDKLSRENSSIFLWMFWIKIKQFIHLRLFVHSIEIIIANFYPKTCRWNTLA